MKSNFLKTEKKPEPEPVKEEKVEEEPVEQPKEEELSPEE